MKRRHWIHACARTLPALGLAGSARAAQDAVQVRVPDENAPHTRTWMAFTSSASIWGRRLPAVQEDLIRIATAIAAHEPVTMLANADGLARARSLLAGRTHGTAVQLLETRLDDLWIRDTGPIFVQTRIGSELRAIDAHFNGWGGKQAHARDREVAVLVAAASMTPRYLLEAVMEGGALEVDGQGTALIKESCVLNPNRNPGVDKAAMERRLRAGLGLDKIIWLPGPAGGDITDGHTDFYARFAAPGRVVVSHDAADTYGEKAVTQAIIDVLARSTDARGRAFTLEIIPTPEVPASPDAASPEFAASYINYYPINGALLMPLFGDVRADEFAQRQLRRLFPQRRMLGLRIDALAAGGGGIHCATLHQPLVT